LIHSQETPAAFELLGFCFGGAVSESHRNSYLNLIRVVKAAVRVRQNCDKILLERIRKELSENQSFLDRRWLETKILELGASLSDKRIR